MRLSSFEWQEAMPSVVPQCISVRLHLSKMFRPLIFSGEQTFLCSHKCKQTLELGVWGKGKIHINIDVEKTFTISMRIRPVFCRFFIPSKFMLLENNYILYDLFVEGVVQTICFSCNSGFRNARAMPL